MKRGLVLLRFVSAVIVLLFVVQVTECNAQKNATKRFERETFGKSRRSKPVKESGESKAAAKAMKEQARKEARREKEDDKALRQLRDRHYQIQSEGTKMRMENNNRNTAEKYKVKRQKQRREQTEPDLKKPRQPAPDRTGPKLKTKDPSKQPEMKQQKQKARSKVKDPSKQPVLKQGKKRVKTVDPKRQPKIKQHKVKKY